MVNRSVWDALYDNPDETCAVKKRSDYLILIQARLNGQPGTEVDKAERFGLSVELVRDLTKGKVDKFNQSESQPRYNPGV